MNVPNILTTMRFFLIPVFVVIIFSDSEHALMVSLGVFLIAGITDVLDGFIARKYNLITKFGTVMDPLADKLMLLTVLICYTIKDMIPIWIVLVMVTKELLMIIGGLYLYYCKEEHVVPSNKFGKLATVLFYVAILVLVFNPGNSYGVIALTVAVFFKLLAFSNYYLGFRKIRN